MLRISETWKQLVSNITNDDRALEQFNKSVCFQNGRYYITWPCKCENPDLLEAALSRLKSLARHFERDSDLLRKYNEVIQSQVKQGVIERVVDTKKGRNITCLTTQF